MSPLPFNNDVLRGWVAWQTPFAVEDAQELVVEVEDETKTYIGVYGYSPYPSTEYCAFMESLNFFVEDMAEGEVFTGLTLIIGEDGWDPDILGNYLDRAVERADELGYRVRIYSQEMFLFRVMSGIDPFDAPIEVLKEFGHGHYALDFLAELGFDWPSCRAISVSETKSNENDWLKKSPLSAMGYRVGKSGIDVSQRHSILKKAFHGQLPIVGSVSYMSEWGAPYSTVRLKKMADSLAAYVSYARRRNSDRELAIDHWQADLEWLKKKFYTGRFEFQWPPY